MSITFAAGYYDPIDQSTIDNLGPKVNRTVTIVLPEGYKNGEEFAKDCGFELVREGDL